MALYETHGEAAPHIAAKVHELVERGATPDEIDAKLQAITGRSSVLEDNPVARNRIAKRLMNQAANATGGR